MFEKIKKYFKNLIKKYMEIVKELEKNRNKEFNSKIDNLKETKYEKNELNGLNEKIIKNNIQSKSDFYKTLKEDNLLNGINKENKKKFNIIYADDHPGALFQIYNDLRAIIEKRTHILDITPDLEEKINNFKINFNYFNLISFGTEMASYKIEFILDKYIPDMVILDIVFGGIIKDGNKIIIQDGIDIGEKILEKNPNCIIVYYTGTTLQENTKENLKLKELIDKYKNNIFITDKDINDTNRLQVLYDALVDLIKRNPNKYEKLSEKVYHEKCSG